MKHYKVVAAVIIYNNKILCVQKGKTRFAYTSYKYEFPGGKVEPHESKQEALKREIEEELNYEITVGKELITVEHQYPDFAITMTAFLCTATNSALSLSEHVSACWLECTELISLDWAEADIPIVRALMEHELPV